MTAFLSELGKKLADRWLTALVLPGLLFLAAVAVARLVGHRHALDATRLASEVERVMKQIGTKPASVVLVIVGVLLAATAAGLLSQAVAAGVRRTFTARRPKRLIAWRAGRSKVSLPRYRPARLTSIGDRFRLADERVDVQFGLSLGLAWPRIWLLAGENTTTAVTNANTRYRAATETTAWGVLLLALGTLWWPAAAAGVVTVVVGRRQSHVRGAVLAELVEATVDIHQRQLAEAVGVELPHGRITPAEGLRINDVLNKRA